MSNGSMPSNRQPREQLTEETRHAIVEAIQTRLTHPSGGAVSKRFTWKGAGTGEGARLSCNPSLRRFGAAFTFGSGALEYLGGTQFGEIEVYRLTRSAQGQSVVRDREKGISEAEGRELIERLNSLIPM